MNSVWVYLITQKIWQHIEDYINLHGLYKDEHVFVIKKEIFTEIKRKCYP